MPGPWAISDRSGFRYPMSEMRQEWTGALVHKSEYEEKHPQLEPFRDFGDPMPVHDARPDDGFGVTVDPITVVRFTGAHLDAGNTFKIALYSAPLLDSVTAYTATGEVTGTGYTAAGAILSGVTISAEAFGDSLTATDPEWEASTIEGAVAALVYETGSGNAVAIFDWRYVTSSAGGTFTVDMPAASVATRAIAL
jgi:hypothetical protein